MIPYIVVINFLFAEDGMGNYYVYEWETGQNGPTGQNSIWHTSSRNTFSVKYKHCFTFVVGVCDNYHKHVPISTPYANCHLFEVRQHSNTKVKVWSAYDGFKLVSCVSCRLHTSFSHLLTEKSCDTVDLSKHISP